MFNWKKPTVQMLGRWQPWHDGHQELFKRCISKTGQVIIQLVPNITNITYGRGVGYEIEEESFSSDIESISATKIRKNLRDEGKIK